MVATKTDSTLLMAWKEEGYNDMKGENDVNKTEEADKAVGTDQYKGGRGSGRRCRGNKTSVLKWMFL